MKQNKPKNKQLTGHKTMTLTPRNSTKEFKYELTIAMIVKNEMKYLRKLLESLQPLRDALNTQLIITDTGSSDGTIEVAKEFADVYLEFEWCNDFSAARNTAVDVAEGRWFFWVDADNVFDPDIVEVAEFIRSPEALSYDAANMIVRSYAEYENKNSVSSDIIKALVINFSKEKRYFINAVHESIPIFTDNAYLFKTIMHHWGYTTDQPVNKRERNTPIMLEEIEKDPLNFKNHLQLCMSLQDMTLRKEHIFKALKLAEEHPKEASENFAKYHIHCIKIQLLPTAVRTTDQELFQTACTMLEGSFSGTLMELEYLGWKIEMHRILKEEKEAVETFERYKTLFHALEKTPDLVTNIFYVYIFNDVLAYQDLEAELTTFLIKENHHSLARKIQDSTILYKLPHLTGDYSMGLHQTEHAFTLENFQLIGDMYEFYAKHATPKDFATFIMSIEKLSLKLSAENQKKYFTEVTRTIKDSYSAICKLRLEDFDLSTCPTDAIDYLKKDSNLYTSNLFAEVFLSYVKSGQDPLDLLTICPLSQLSKWANYLFSTKKDFADHLANAFNNPNFAINSMKEEKLWANLGYRALLNKAEATTVDSDSFTLLFTQTTELMYGYVSKVYNQALISPQGKDVLSSEELFSYYAYQSLQEKDPLNSIRILGQALTLCPLFKSVVSHMIAKYKEPPQEIQQQNEFAALAQQLKSSIRTLVTALKVEEAQELLEKYKSINPNDPELDKLFQLCKK